MILLALRAELGPHWLFWTLLYAFVAGVSAGLTIKYFGVA
jgi:hypothetical protein